MNHKFETLMSRLRDYSKRNLPEGSHVWLYGSRARGSYRVDSDWDILIIINKESAEQQDFSNYAYPLCLLGSELDQAVIPVIYGKKQWDKLKSTPFYKNVTRDKVIIR